MLTIYSIYMVYQYSCCDSFFLYQSMEENFKPMPVSVTVFMCVIISYVVCSSGLSGSVMNPYGPAGICLYYSWARLMNWTQTQS